MTLLCLIRIVCFIIPEKPSRGGNNLINIYICLLLHECHHTFGFIFSDALETNDICKKIWNPIGYGYSENNLKRDNITWYYDTATQSCKQFQSLGCLGNENNFKTESICRAKCSSKHIMIVEPFKIHKRTNFLSSF